MISAGLKIIHPQGLAQHMTFPRFEKFLARTQRKGKDKVGEGKDETEQYKRGWIKDIELEVMI